MDFKQIYPPKSFFCKELEIMVHSCSMVECAYYPCKKEEHDRDYPFTA